jgi:hypothetical protein
MPTESELSTAITRLDLWFDTMRAPEGFAGPVSHWWDSSLVYAGAMHDWRYEGIVCGYLNLYGQTNEARWLEKACRACDDLVSAQTTDGHFTNSCFEHGPGTFGTPHEAAADIALLETSQTLKTANDLRWKIYFDTAEKNIQSLLPLFNGRGFRDQLDNAVLVANKNATILEALLLYQDLAGKDMQEYIDAAVQVIKTAQIKDGFRIGATIHRGTFDYQISFGIYTSRCVGALVRLMKMQSENNHIDFIKSACDYLRSLILSNTTLLGHYSHKAIYAPQWISPSGDLLRALVQAQTWIDIPTENIQALARIMLRGQQPSGGIATSQGLARRGALSSKKNLSDFRDVLPVAGWCDKSFRALTMLGIPNNATLSPTELVCEWRGQPAVYHEDHTQIKLINKHEQTIYSWEKGKMYPDIMKLWN